MKKVYHSIILNSGSFFEKVKKEVTLTVAQEGEEKGNFIIASFLTVAQEGEESLS